MRKVTKIDQGKRERRRDDGRERVPDKKGGRER